MSCRHLVHILDSLPVAPVFIPQATRCDPPKLEGNLQERTEIAEHHVRQSRKLQASRLQIPGSEGSEATVTRHGSVSFSVPTSIHFH